MEYKKIASQPIGVFDSGVGGISVLGELAAILPNENYIYFGDRKNVPYGIKTPNEVKKLVDKIVNFLFEKQVKIIVVACNTATAFAIEFLREKYHFIDFVGMEPAVKPAALTTKTGKIGVLATSLTLKGGHFTKTKSLYASNVEVLEQEGSGLVQIVEQNKIGSLESINLLKRYIEPMLVEGVDKLVLGCTHYPFLIGDIKRVIGEDNKVEILNPANAVAQRVKILLEDARLLNESNKSGTVKIYSNNSNFEIFHHLCTMSGKKLNYTVEYIEI